MKIKLSLDAYIVEKIKQYYGDEEYQKKTIESLKAKHYPHTTDFLGKPLVDETVKYILLRDNELLNSPAYDELEGSQSAAEYIVENGEEMFTADWLGGKDSQLSNGTLLYRGHYIWEAFNKLGYEVMGHYKNNVTILVAIKAKTT